MVASSSTSGRTIYAWLPSCRPPNSVAAANCSSARLREACNLLSSNYLSHAAKHSLVDMHARGSQGTPPRAKHWSSARLLQALQDVLCDGVQICTVCRAAVATQLGLPLNLSSKYKVRQTVRRHTSSDCVMKIPDCPEQHTACSARPLDLNFTSNLRRSACLALSGSSMHILAGSPSTSPRSHCQRST